MGFLKPYKSVSILLILVPATLVNASLVLISFSTSAIFELNVVVCKYAVKLVFVANPLISGIFLSTLSILSSKALVSVENLVLVAKLLVSTVFVLSTFISAKLSKAFLFTSAICDSILETLYTFCIIISFFNYIIFNNITQFGQVTGHCF